MTQEDKQLLLKDLCARLLYGVKLNFYSAATKENYTCALLGIEPNDDKSIIAKVDSGAFMFPAEHIKPYLRPMSSMTIEEKKEFQACHCVYELHPDFQPMMCNLANELNMFDWFNAHHFDYRGLIRKGLALEAPDGMYKTE